MKLRLGFALLALLAITQVSCGIHDYCIACEKGDAGLDGMGGDGSDGGDASNCVPTGDEVCDGKDNDCDGIIDEGALPGVGDLCMNQVGACAGGKQICSNGQLTCDKKPSAEICDNIDNDCNGLTDEGDPGGGGKCGTDVGECVAGVNHCINGAQQCIGAIGTVGGQPEVCNGKDDDCDGLFDEGLTNLGSCGTSNVGECKLGTLMCQGGTPVCVGAVNATFELCDGLDNDCDGTIDNGYDLDTDPQNCGMCGHICGSGILNGGEATWACAAGLCEVASCKAGYHDNNNDPSDGCEYGVCFASGVEVCDGVDNDCNGFIDDGLTPPAICATKGECAGSTASCMGADGWVCDYGSTVSTDGMGNIVAETLCDGLDNDCNGIIDDHQPNLGLACHDNGIGACQTAGVFICDPGNLNGAAICNAPGGGTPSPEQCNNIDDDCDGVIDNGGSTGSLLGQDWVSIGGGRQMMQYEASRPDSDSSGAGSVNTLVCSKPDVVPWTDVTYPQAVAACAAVGARLCTETEWQHACSTTTPVAYPIVTPATGSTDITIEAEDYYSIASNTDTTVTPNVVHSWAPDETPGFSGIFAMAATPNTGSNISNTNAITMSPRLDYQITFSQAGMYRICVAGYNISGNDNSVWVGVNSTLPGSSATLQDITDNTTGSWHWLPISTAYNLTAGQTKFVSLYMREDGFKVDQIYITSGTTCPATITKATAGNTWAYGTSPNTYTAGANGCNDENYQATESLIPTASEGGGNCYANDGATSHVFDMSGNAKEWTAAHQIGQNPIRGGSYNNTGPGIACALDFTLADNSFFFPNVGFRCCR